MHNQAKEIADRLNDAAAKGDKEGVERVLRDAKESRRPFASKARSAPALNSQQQKQILNKLDALANLFAEQEGAARDYSNNPRDSARKVS